MSYYGIYGTLRPTGGSTGASHGLSSQKNKTLGASQINRSPGRTTSSQIDRSPGRTTSHYLSPYSTTWHRPRSPSPIRHVTAGGGSTVHPDRHQSHERSHYSQSKVGQRSLSPTYGLDYYYHQERSPTRKEYRSDYPKREYGRVRSAIPTRNTVWTDLSLRYPKKTIGYKPDSYTASKVTRRSESSYSGLYDHSSGWRERLAQQGYVASTAPRTGGKRRPPERSWHYLDDGESGDESSEEFTDRTSRGCGHEDEKQQHDSVISRTRRMRLGKMEGAFASGDVSIQVDVEDLAKHRELEERRVQRTFISSRHHSWYDTGATSYKKYLSPMPWRGCATYSSRLASSYREGEDIKDSKDNNLSKDDKGAKDNEDNKDFRKSVLNVDLPQTEAQVFARRQAETRWRRTLEDTSYYTSEDGSPSETGYDSSFTDADRSSGETEGFLTDSLDRSTHFGLGSSYRSSQRSTPFGDPFTDDPESACSPYQPGEYDSESVCPGGSDVAEFPPGDYDSESVCPRDGFDDSVDFDDGGSQEVVLLGDIMITGKDKLDHQVEKPPEMSPKHLENLCFRFKSLAEGPSQRDSGFSEICSNHCDSPVLNVESDPETYTKELLPPSDRRGLLIGCCSDIDQLLLPAKDFDSSAFQTFEDFDRVIERQKTNVRTRLDQCCGGWSKPARVGLRLDLEACERFVGTCHDIDEMLGAPTPLSPDSEDTDVVLDEGRDRSSDIA